MTNPQSVFCVGLEYTVFVAVIGPWVQPASIARVFLRWRVMRRLLMFKTNSLSFPKPGLVQESYASYPYLLAVVVVLGISVFSRKMLMEDMAAVFATVQCTKNAVYLCRSGKMMTIFGLENAPMHVTVASGLLANVVLARIVTSPVKTTIIALTPLDTISVSRATR
jgi:hypothetical protein